MASKTQKAALKRTHAETLRKEMQSGVVRRAATFTDRKRQASKNACRKGNF